MRIGMRVLSMFNKAAEEANHRYTLGHACQAPLSLEDPRQEYWSGQTVPSQGTLTQGRNLCIANRFLLSGATREAQRARKLFSNSRHPLPMLVSFPLAFLFIWFCI